MVAVGHCGVVVGHCVVAVGHSGVVVILSQTNLMYLTVIASNL